MAGACCGYAIGHSTQPGEDADADDTAMDARAETEAAAQVMGDWRWYGEHACAAAAGAGAGVEATTRIKPGRVGSGGVEHAGHAGQAADGRHTRDSDGQR